jgi:hypothetical protein
MNGAGLGEKVTVMSAGQKLLHELFEDVSKEFGDATLLNKSAEGDVGEILKPIGEVVSSLEGKKHETLLTVVRDSVREWIRERQFVYKKGVVEADPRFDRYGFSRQLESLATAIATAGKASRHEQQRTIDASLAPGRRLLNQLSPDIVLNLGSATRSFPDAEKQLEQILAPLEHQLDTVDEGTEQTLIGILKTSLGEWISEHQRPQDHRELPMSKQFENLATAITLMLES